jgi:hypothetical protein
MCSALERCYLRTCRRSVVLMCAPGDDGEIIESFADTARTFGTPTKCETAARFAIPRACGYAMMMMGPKFPAQGSTVP